ncbi:MAG: hypothetical protein V7603_1129 [Micromonosporaceae bacterium]
MPSNRRWSVSDGRKLATGILAVSAFFIVSASVGAQSWELAALGVAVLAAGITLYVVSAMNSRSFAYVPGTAHVISSSPPPAAALQGRCEMQIVVHAPGMDDVAVKIRDAGVPVSKWPDPGATLPILVAIGDPRRVRVLWDNVRTHGEMADGRGEVFDGDVAIDEPYDLFDSFPEPASVDGDESYVDDRVIEFDIDPTGVILDPDPPAVSVIDASVDEPAGEDPAAGTAAESPPPARTVPPRPRPRPSPRPSPRPRRPVESVDPTGSSVGGIDPDAGDGGSSVAVADRPGARASTAEPGAGLATDQESGAAAEPAATEPATGRAASKEQPGDTDDPPTLQIQHLVPASPAVPAIPDPAPPHGALPEEETGEISDAYLAVSPPPGQGGPGPVYGVGVTLFVSNLGRSVSFYRDLLGFQQVDMGPGSAVLESGDGRIVLRRVVDMAPVDRRLVYLLLEVADVQVAYEDLRARGVEFVHRPRAVSRYEQLELWSAAFRDPDGHGIALTRWDLRH